VTLTETHPKHKGGGAILKPGTMKWVRLQNKTIEEQLEMWVKRGEEHQVSGLIESAMRHHQKDLVCMSTSILFFFSFKESYASNSYNCPSVMTSWDHHPE
jgi:hypothetical protein